VDGKGRLDMRQHMDLLTDKVAIVSVMRANNESGTLFPVEDMAMLAKSAGVMFHADAVQDVGKLPINLADSAIDMLSLSGHKLHAPKGIGVLYLRRNTRFRPLLRGGHQERGRCAGTENTASMVGRGKACEMAMEHMEYEKTFVRAMRDRLERGIVEAVPNCFVTGDPGNRLPNTCKIAFEYIEGEVILLLLNKLGIAASSGSACTSGSLEPSHVMRAMGEGEREVIRHVADLGLNACLMVWARMSVRDIAQFRGLGVDLVDLAIPVSDQQLANKLGKDRDWALEQIRRTVPAEQDLGLAVCVGAEDASRAVPACLWQVAETAQAAGAQRIRFADTLGMMEPFTVFERIRDLATVCDLEIEMHAHDDLGLATANTLAAACAGATHVNTRVHGIGERAGNAALEEMVMGLKHLHGLSTGVDLSRCETLSRLVATASGKQVAWHKSLVGDGAFSHEAGIHVDGLLEDVGNYQGVDPPRRWAEDTAGCWASIPDPGPCASLMPK
jgi:hypothetical protein